MNILKIREEKGKRMADKKVRRKETSYILLKQKGSIAISYTYDQVIKFTE